MGNDVDYLIEYLNKHSSLPYDFISYAKVYSMTTENIYGFLNNYDLRNKRVLTVAGSGDQRLNSYLLGAREVTCFDINKVCDLHLRLKDTAIKNLSFEEFIKFFGVLNNNEKALLDRDIFDKLSDKLDYDVFRFYNYIINEADNNSPKCIYYDYDNPFDLMKTFNGYLDKDKYNELSRILENKDVKFINTDISFLPEVLNGEKFDMILLSNISDYVHMVYPFDEHLERFKELIDKLVENNLNLYGIIQVGYIYSEYGKGAYISDFCYDNKRNKVLPNYMYHSVMVDSFYQKDKKDKVITYQKLK